ncbi:Protein of unknown function [Amphritea atlantica]|jgi:hypothetical protein|uniref:DUF2878 domain-containing protein n=1 Tax=Amphritea atlantica TaxID=355243 RepID=A0A1H9GM19_9GAMM|nr:DUF2878 domain-containing protein [Amphritea atlantica]SEQ51054.1 Protein of unknown function [Amphritea atlantica]
MKSGLSQNFWVNQAGFQLAWWSAILLTSQSVAVLVVLLLLHLWFHRQPVHEVYVVLLCGLTGFAVDLLLTLAGLFRFPSTPLPPLWLLLLWFCFAATLNQSLRFFHKRWVVASVCGGVAGSLAYSAAAKLGAVSLGVPWLPGALILMFIWMALFPLQLWISGQHFSGEGRGAY